LHSEELHNLYASSNLIRQIKLRRIRWVGHVACMREERKVTRFWRESPKERDHSRVPKHRWKDGIKLDLGEIGKGGGWNGFNSLRTGTDGRLL
jgi:hypothetical protein